MARRKPVGIVRGVVVDALRPLLPRDWKFFPYRATEEAITQTTVWVKLSSIEKLPEAPQSGHHFVSYTITIAVPNTDPSEADARLDDEVIELVQSLDMLPNVRRASAEPVAVNTAEYWGYDVSIQIITHPVKN